ncbi:UbiA family prenyltransferase [Chitinophaga tropicalis]|uniref:4-hydroxybenzoate polyprenyltransferase n=1 Tax=Chitinophaga tropicalis TaxID=2683588 RepID=A0A7K1U211_9BACT|nr:UbiA family prenyltransferase [Chitinophaga tropicalis]MVT08340.1 hypothetical protein [Chitinophaga tropicalis]
MFSILQRELALSLARAISREILIVWKFIDNNIWDTILPSLMIFATGWIYNDSPWADLPLTLLTSVTYAVLYIYTFCLSNQIAGIEEDRINKPYRPLVTGLVTVREAYRRMYIYNLVYALYALYLGIFWYSLAWIVVSYYLNLRGGSKHWITKNIVGMTLATFLLFNVQWHISLSDNQFVNSRLESYFALMSAWAGCALHLQDLRDVAGDKLLGRKTLPISIGDAKARQLLFIHYLFFLPGVFLCSMLTICNLEELRHSWKAVIVFGIQLFVHWTVAFRLLKYRDPESDHKTYIIYVILFVATIPTVCFIQN